MEVADPKRVDAQPPAGRVPGPCPQGSGNEDEEDANVRPATREHEERCVKAADQQGENGSRADSHPASIETPSAGDGPRLSSDPAAPQYGVATVEDRGLAGRGSPDRLVRLHRPPAAGEWPDRGGGGQTAVPYLHLCTEPI